MRGRYLLPWTASLLAALALRLVPQRQNSLQGQGNAAAKHPPKVHDAITVGIAYRHGLLILSSAKAGPATILLRSADGHHKFVASVALITPTTTLTLKKLFPKITHGRYRVVVLPGFKDGFLSGRWIIVH